MYLTRIEMNGFKSFNTKKELIIKKGITGVVGPNGSGKSNIADAIRWVLGEQSSKNLRGVKMEDVIFNGTEQYSKKGYCEVELAFDNSDHKVKNDYDEISVRRKMYRSGESEYYINGTLCRLKDVIELFRDTGIGKEGYSIIGQGRIDEILNSKPAQRRRVFEEAAGIMKYRARKEEAERNLEKTKENLIRLEDIIHELEIQAEPLKEQMETAKQFVSLRERLKQLEVNLYLYNHDKLIERLDKLSLQQKENAEEIEENNSNVVNLSSKIQEVKSQLSQVQSELDASNADIASLSSNQERLRGEYNLILEREKNASQLKKELENNIESFNAFIEEQNEKLAGLSADIELVNADIDESSERISALDKEKKDKQGAVNEYNESLITAKENSEKCRNELEKCRRHLSESTVKRDIAEEKIRQFENSDSEIREQGRTLKTEIEDLKNALLECESKKDKALKTANETAVLRQRSKVSLDAALLELNELKNSFAQKNSSIKLLTGLKESYEGYASGVKGLLSDKNSDAGIKKSLIGTVADVINVPKKYEVAIETLLGNSLQNVVVEKESDAKNAIEYLRRNNLGRVTFLPLEALHIKYLNDEEADKIKGISLGVASEIIECSDKVRKAIDFLLSRTVVVEDLDSAFAVMKKTGYGLRTVTLKGDIIRPGGSVTGGSQDKQNHGFLSRNRILDELKKDVVALGNKIDALSSDTENKKAELEKYTAEHSALIDAISACEIEKTQISADLNNAKDKYSDISYRAEKAEERLQNAQKEFEEMSEEVCMLEEELAAKQKEFDESFAKFTEFETYVKSNSQEIADILLKMQKEELDRLEFIAQKEKHLLSGEHIRSEIARVNSDIESSLTRIEDIDKELSGEISSNRKNIVNQLDEIIYTLKNTSAKVREIFNLKEQLSDEIVSLEKEYSKKSELQGDLIEQKYKITTQIEKTALQQTNVENRIWEDYSLTYANALELKTDDFSYQSGTKEIDEIKEYLQQMGAVNPNAIEDFARVNDRLQDLLMQKEDLEKAGEDLKVVISSLLSDMRGCFIDKFDMINSKFKEIFKTLFGGGRADLVIVDPDDVMESGIDIIAEPPGKKLQNLSLLSGGEKALCAISLLFAMLDINPSPICLLDEIDAPLDDANLYRFSDYLKKLSATLQFIVITHRKPTMGVCDTLYGIAMQKKGISEILSVDLH